MFYFLKAKGDRLPTTQSGSGKKQTDKKQVDKKQADKKPSEKKPAEKKTTEKKAADKKPADKKQADKKPGTVKQMASQHEQMCNSKRKCKLYILPFHIAPAELHLAISDFVVAVQFVDEILK